MDAPIPDKAFFRIGEVSKILGVDPYVVRYWEMEFKSIKPVRTSSDQRLYRRKDLEELLTIKKLLYEDGFTIRGAKRQLLTMRNEPTWQNESLSDNILSEIKKGLKEIKDIVG